MVAREEDSANVDTQRAQSKWPRRDFLLSAAGLVIGCASGDNGTGVVSTGKLSIVISGLSPTAASGGQVSILRTSEAGAASALFPVPPSGTLELIVPVGTYSVTFTVPTAHEIPGGATQSVSTGIVVVANADVSVPFTVVAILVFATPNILDNLSFETDFDSFNDGGAGPVTNVVRSTAQAFHGTTSVEFAWAPNASDTGAAFFRSLGGGRDDLWVRFYVRFETGWSITTVQKFNRFRNGSTSPGAFGGWYLSNAKGLAWGFDVESSAVTAGIVPKASIADGVWHSVECHYRRNGDPLPSAAFWFNGEQITRPDGADPAGFGLTWVGGRLVGGPTRGASHQITLVQWVGTLNGGNTGSGKVWIDRVAASTAGRIGP